MLSKISPRYLLAVLLVCAVLLPVAAYADEVEVSDGSSEVVKIAAIDDATAGDGIASGKLSGSASASEEVGRDGDLLKASSSTGAAVEPSANANRGSLSEKSSSSSSKAKENPQETLADGTYSFGSEAADGKVADCKDGATADGTRVQSWEANGTDAQVWRVETSDDGSSTIYHAASGKALDVVDGNAYCGAAVQLWQANGTGAQKWYFVQEGTSYKIVSLLDSTLVLDLSGAGTANGTPIRLWNDNGTAAQRWYLKAAKTIRQKADDLASENIDVLADGSYSIETVLAFGKVIDVPSANAYSGAILQSWESNGTDAQVWTISHDSAGYITVTHTDSGKVLDVCSGEAFQGASVQLWDSNGTWAQKWIAVSADGGFKLLSAVNSDFALDVMSASKANGAKLWLYSDNGTVAQQWTVSSATTARMRLDSLAAENKNLIEDGNYGIRSDLLIALVLDARDGGASDGTAIQTYTTNDTYAQYWTVSHDEEGYVTFTNIGSGKVLDVCDGNASSGAKVQLWSPNSTWAQKWIVARSGSAYVIISALSSSLVLDVSGASKANCANVQIYESNGTSAQKWHFTKAGKGSVSVQAIASGNAIAPTYIGYGDYFIALPSYASAESTTLNFDQDVLLGTLVLSVEKGNSVTLSEASIIELEGLVEIDVADSAHAALTHLYIMRSSGMASVFVKSEDPEAYGREWVESSEDHSNAAKGNISVVAADGSSIYDGKLSQIKGRGNSSWWLSKRPYQIKLDKKADLAQTGSKENKSKTWLLISDGYDDSSSRNLIAYSYAQLMGVSSAIDFNIVDFYYDGEYRGTYLLTEKVQIGSGRVDVEDLEEANEDLNSNIDDANVVEGYNSYGCEIRYAEGVVDPDDITGGYLIEHESEESRYKAESAYFAVWTGSCWEHFVCKSPEVWSYAEANYMSCLIQDIFDAANNNGVVPTWRGSSRAGMCISDLVDLDSMANIYWVNEALKNADGYTYSSGYFYKDADADGISKVCLGPAWDFDLSCGSQWSSEDLSAEGWYTRSKGLFESLMNTSYVSNAIQACKANAIATLRTYVNSGALGATMGRIEASLNMNEVVWGGKDETYADVRSWINQRLNWLEHN